MMDPNKIRKMTPEEKDAIARHLLRMPLKTKEQLHLWLINYLGVNLADCIVSRFATSTPLDMVWDVYSFCADTERDRPIDIRYIAGRSSQKTLSMAALQVLLPLHFKRSVVHFGGTVDQANRAYEYFRQFVTKPYIKDYLKTEPTQKQTIFNIDGTDVKIEILPLSPMSVQGPHAPVVSLDELASLAPDKIRAYKDVPGIPSYTIDGRPWVKFGISSRKGADTIIEREYEEREKTGTIFKFWTVLENTQRCPDSISGTVPLSYYVNVIDNSALLEQDYANLSDLEKSKYEKVNAYEGCFKCALKTICAGDLKKQTSKCPTLRPAVSVIEEFKNSDFQWFLSQKMSLTPSLEGLIFSKFKREIFEKTPREIYKIFAGKDPEKELTEEELIQFMLSKGVKAYAGLDHGYTDPAAIVVIYEDSVGTIYIMRVYAQVALDPEQLIEKIKELQNKYKFTHLYPDTSQPAINDLIRKARFVNVIDDFDKKGQISNGIALIRQKISPTDGGTKLYGIKGNCDFFIKEMEMYHNEVDASGKVLDKPVDEFNHSIDALRYAAVNRWDKKSSISMTVNLQDSNPQAQQAALPQNTINDNWLKNEILKHTNGSGTKTKKSSGGGIMWDI